MIHTGLAYKSEVWRLYSQAAGETMAQKVGQASAGMIDLRVEERDAVKDLRASGTIGASVPPDPEQNQAQAEWSCPRMPQHEVLTFDAFAHRGYRQTDRTA